MLIENQGEHCKATRAKESKCQELSHIEFTDQHIPHSCNILETIFWKCNSAQFLLFRGAVNCVMRGDFAGEQSTTW